MFASPPPAPALGIPAMIWAAFWSPSVAKEMGVFRAWLSGDPTTLVEMSRRLPIVVGMLERDRAAATEFREILRHQ